MRDGPRTIRWRDHDFRFETFTGRDDWSGASPIWAVSRHGEFIGTMPSSPKETTQEFELRCIRWLIDLIH